MSTDYRALCAELLADYEQHLYRSVLADRARAALAEEPVVAPAGPKDEELTLTYAYAVAAAVDYQRGPFNKADAEAAQLSGLRAVLARYGHQPAPPAEGEVAELAMMDLSNAINVIESVAGFTDADTPVGEAWAVVLAQLESAPAPAGELLKEAAWLRNECSAENADGNWISMSIDQALDLASLLERQAAPVPVAVGPNDDELDAVVIAIQALTPHQPDATTQDLAAVDQGREILLHCLARWGRPAAAPAEGGEAAHIRRMCDIILGNTFGNEELDSLALLVGHHPDVLNTSPPPAEGKVAELVEWLRNMANAALGGIDELNADRAADLLEQRHPAPVPVSERLPGAEDCDAEGRCWLHLPDMGTEPLWRLTDPSMRSRYHSHWLSYPSLPLPDQK